MLNVSQNDTQKMSQFVKQTLSKKEKEVQKIEVKKKKKLVEKQVSRLLKCHSQDEKDHSDVATVKRKDIRFI